MSYLGWFDPDKKKSVVTKAGDAVTRYRERFGAEPDTLLVSAADCDGIAEGWPVMVDGTVIEVRAVSFLPRNVFYAGVDDSAGVA